MKKRHLICILSAILLIGCGTEKAIDTYNESTNNTASTTVTNEKTHKAEEVHKTINEEDNTAISPKEFSLENSHKRKTELAILDLILNQKALTTKNENDLKPNMFPVNKIIEGKLKWGYMDTNGEIVVPLTYDRTYDFNSQGYGFFKDMDKYGVISMDGKIIEDAKFKEVYFYNPDAYLVKNKFDEIILKKKISTSEILYNVDSIEIFAKDYYVANLKDGTRTIFNDSGDLICNIKIPLDEIVTTNDRVIIGKNFGEYTSLDKYFVFNMKGHCIAKISDTFDCEIKKLLKINKSNLRVIQQILGYDKILGNSCGFNKRGSEPVYSVHEPAGYFHNILGRKVTEKKYIDGHYLEEDMILGVTIDGFDLLHEDLSIISHIKSDYYRNFTKIGDLIKADNVFSGHPCDKFAYFDLSGKMLWEGYDEDAYYKTDGLLVGNVEKYLNHKWRETYPVILTEGYSKINTFIEDNIRLKPRSGENGNSDKWQLYGDTKIEKMNNIFKITKLNVCRGMVGRIVGINTDIYYLTIDGKKLSTDNIFTGMHQETLTSLMKNKMKDENKRRGFEANSTDLIESYNWEDDECTFDFTKKEVIFKYSNLGKISYHSAKDFFFSYEELRDILNKNHPLIKNILRLKD